MDKKAYLEQIDKVNREGRYKPDWDSLATHPVPAWYGEKRLGIFLHWGPFSVPAYHDWYARNMYMKGSPEYEHHLKHWGAHKDFGYKDFIPMFRAEGFDPDQWAALFREAFGLTAAEEGDNLWGVGLGIVLILASLVFRYGAELEGRESVA